MQFLTFWNLPQFPSPRWTRHQQPHANAASSNPCPAGTECLLLSTRPRPGGRLTKRAGVRRRFPASESVHVASAVFLQNQGFDRLQLLSPDFPASREHAPRRGSSSRVAPISLVPCGLLATWAGRRLIAVFTQEGPAPCRGVGQGCVNSLAVPPCHLTWTRLRLSVRNAGPWQAVGRFWLRWFAMSFVVVANWPCALFLFRHLLVIFPALLALFAS